MGFFKAPKRPPLPAPTPPPEEPVVTTQLDSDAILNAERRRREVDARTGRRKLRVGLGSLGAGTGLSIS